jgi:tape measure domain-containing protein
MANGAKMMLKLGIDVSDLSRELGKVETAMARFGSKMQSIGSTMTQSLTLPIIGIGTASLKAFADIEKLQNGLTAIMGSSEAAATELEKLRKVAENPGLALPEVVKASSALQSVGMSADQARETITQFGNAVARSPKPDAETFSGVTLALAQMSAVGKVTQEDLNQLKERLPEFADVMKNEFGTATAEGIRSMGLSSEDFIKRTVSALSELERAKGGLGNAFDNLKDNVTASLAELGKTINESLKVEEAFSVLSNKLNSLVQGFKMLKPEIQGFLVYFGLAVAAIGPAIFIIGKLISTYGALAGAAAQVVKALGGINNALNYLAKNPQVLLITAAIAALGAIALYVYDNWKAFSDRFTNIWINIKNSVMSGVASVLKSIDNLQKSLGLKLFNLQGLTEYQKEQRIVATEFKSIGETVDSLKGKLAGLFTTGAKTGGSGGGGAGIASFTTGTAAATGGEGGAVGAAREGVGLIGMLPTLDLLPDKITSVAAANERLKQTNEDVANSFKKITPEVKSIADMLTPMQKSLVMGIEAFANLAESGFKSMKDLAAAVRQSIAVIVGDMIKVFVAKALAGLPPTPFMLAIAPAIAALAGSLGKSLIMKIGAPKLAQGGLAFAPTMAMVGDNRNARVDPEVIAPLSKLKTMIGEGMGGTLETRISGNDLIILLNRSQKNLSRVQ